MANGAHESVLRAPIRKMANGAHESVLRALILAIWIAASWSQPDTYRRPSLPWYPREDGITCTFWNQTGCATGECCVKEVVTFSDLDKNVMVGTRCKPLLMMGELCLRQTEGYLCDCEKGLFCEFVKNETYGHCSVR